MKLTRKLAAFTAVAALGLGTCVATASATAPASCAQTMWAEGSALSSNALATEALVDPAVKAGMALQQGNDAPLAALVTKYKAAVAQETKDANALAATAVLQCGVKA